MAKLGTYTYKQFTGQVLDTRHNRYKPTFAICTMRVEVVDETQRKYRVKYNGFHANGARPGTLAWVGKEKVKLDAEEPPTPTAPRGEVRLPYKD